MPSQNPFKYNDWWVELNVYFQTTNVNIYPPEQVQYENMQLVMRYFLDKGWTRNAIAGMLGNMMVESSVNPWRFQSSTITWDDPAAIIAYDGGMGLTQWTPARKYYEWAIAEGLDPKSGYSMCDRIYYEQLNNLQWSTDNILNYTWNDYVNSTESPETLARVFVWAYERPAAPVVEVRQDNARWCYDNISLINKMILWYTMTNKRKAMKRVWKKL